jgi:oligopeptide transport system ATP-binding protein
MSVPLLQVRDLTTSFFSARGEVQAVRGVSFDVYSGEILGIVGESGSGKSITCMSILRLLKKSGRILKGEAKFEGRDLLKLDQRELRALRGNDIAVIFQDPMTSLNPTLTVGEQIIETILRHRKVTRAEATVRAIELFDLVRIPSAAARLKSYPHEFSGGMRQRVMIAMALSCDPKLLIADEPTTALDVTIQRQILALLKELQARLGMAVILITHDLGVIAEVTDRLIVLYGGMVMEEGKVRDVFANPRHPYTRGLLSSVPDLREKEHKRLTPIAGAPPDMAHPPKGCPFTPRCPHARAICGTTVPPLFTDKEAANLRLGQGARCWLHHKDAPLVPAINAGVEVLG